jgi:hypothetical protein
MSLLVGLGRNSNQDILGNERRRSCAGAHRGSSRIILDGMSGKC